MSSNPIPGRVNRAASLTARWWKRARPLWRPPGDDTAPELAPGHPRTSTRSGSARRSARGWPRLPARGADEMARRGPVVFTVAREVVRTARGRRDLGLPVRLIDVTHRYGGSADEGAGTIALSNVTLEIEPGAFRAIMGASGSGKSTLLHLVGAIDRPTAGKVLLGDRDIARLPDSELTLVRRQSIGFVFQFFNLVPTLTAMENVRFPLDLSGTAGNRSETARAMLDRVGLARRLDRYPSELSGGEMQRVAIARAVVHRPPILLADEPTGNLDSRTGETILELLRDVHAESGMTMLMATHSHRAATFAQGTLTIVDGCLQGVEAAR